MLDFYRDLLNFREIHELHANWRVSAESRVMVPPCGAIHIPLYEKAAARTDLMHQYLPRSSGERACSTLRSQPTTFACVEQLLANGVQFVEPPPRYYEQLDAFAGGMDSTSSA